MTLGYLFRLGLIATAPAAGILAALLLATVLMTAWSLIRRSSR